MENENQVELTAEEQALLATEFPADIEKLAEAQLDSMDCVEALRTFGEAKAEVELWTAAGNEEEVQKALEKQAAASEVIEEKMKAIRAHNYEDESQMEEEQLNEVLTKEASAAAHIIAEGYFGEYHAAAEQNPELVKEAALMGALKGAAKAAGEDAGKAGKWLAAKAKGAASKAKDLAGKGAEKAKAGASKAKEVAGKGYDKAKAGAAAGKEHVKKNPIKYSALAGAGAGAVGKSLYDKKKDKH